MIVLSKSLNEVVVCKVALGNLEMVSSNLGGVQWSSRHWHLLLFSTRSLTVCTISEAVCFLIMFICFIKQNCSSLSTNDEFLFFSFYTTVFLQCVLEVLLLINSPLSPVYAVWESCLLLFRVILTLQTWQTEPWHSRMRGESFYFHDHTQCKLQHWKYNNLRPLIG